jgi:short-subunit dehydrogenase
MANKDAFWANKVCVITGATSGIGRALSRHLAERGARLGILARGRTALAKTTEELNRLGATVHAISADVASPEEVFAAAEEFERRLGPVDVWVNNAMTTMFSWISDLEPEELRRVTDVTYHGAVWGTMAALRHMAPRDTGIIVQVGSALAYRAIPLQAAYCGGKHAMRAFTDSLRCELRARGQHIQLTMVQLPAVNTPQFVHCRTKLPVKPQPVPPIYDPDVAARGILSATEHGRREAFVGVSTVKAVFAASCRLAQPIGTWPAPASSHR